MSRRLSDNALQNNGTNTTYRCDSLQPFWLTGPGFALEAVPGGWARLGHDNQPLLPTKQEHHERRGPMTNSTAVDPRNVPPIHPLTGLRFLAALAVFVYHARILVDARVHPFPLGPAAVSFFFVLSGYILTWVYHERLRGQPLLGGQVRRFLVTRWGRLWPLHASCLILCITLSPYFRFSNAWTGTNSWPSLGANLLLVHSWFPVRTWFLDFNSVSWSISTEMFFYLTFPLLLACRRRFWILIPVSLGLTMAVLYWSRIVADSPNHPGWFWPESVLIANPLTHWYQFCFGMGLCLLKLRMNASVPVSTHAGPGRTVRDTVIELVLAGCLALIYGWGTRYPRFLPDLTSSFFPILGQWLTIAMPVPVFGAIIYFFATSQGLVARILGTRLAVWLGEISFAFYMIHQIILLVLLEYALDNLGYVALSFFLAIFASAILFRVIEMPCKFAILAAWDGKRDRVVKTAISGTRLTLVQPAGLFQLAALLSLMGVAAVHPPAPPGPGVAGILANNQLAAGGVGFDKDANLVAMNCRLVGKKLYLGLVWKKLRSNQRQRFIHLCAADGQILRQFGGPWRELQAAPAMQLVADQMVIPWSRWRDAAFIATGFWSPESGASKVIRGESDMGGARAPIVSLDPFRDRVE